MNQRSAELSTYGLPANDELQPTIPLGHATSGPTCKIAECKAPLTTASLQTQLDLQIRRHISTYYEHWSRCQDPTCGNRSRSMLMHGQSRMCLKAGCGSEVVVEVRFGSPYFVVWRCSCLPISVYVCAAIYAAAVFFSVVRRQVGGPSSCSHRERSVYVSRCNLIFEVNFQ